MQSCMEHAVVMVRRFMFVLCVLILQLMRSAHVREADIGCIGEATADVGLSVRSEGGESLARLDDINSFEKRFCACKFYSVVILEHTLRE